MFKPRMTRPEAGNRYYITRAAGGWSYAIKGKPPDSDCDVLANCVGYAVGRFHEIAGCERCNLISPVNAENLIENAKAHGLKVGATPELGALIVWQKGKTLTASDGAGHVAVVEEIGKEYIITSESGYNASKPFWTTRRKICGNFSAGDSYIFRGFIYQPENVVLPAMRRGDTGTGVKWLQCQLVEAGYMRHSEIDGNFGKITFGAVLAFQSDNGLTLDGVAGTQTQKKLMEVNQK